MSPCFKERENTNCEIRLGKDNEASNGEQGMDEEMMDMMMLSSVNASEFHRNRCNSLFNSKSSQFFGNNMKDIES